MVSFRSRRLEMLLGTPLGVMLHAHVAGLVASHVSEAFYLDFKAAP